MMTEAQTTKLLETLDSIANTLANPKTYTITGAADWPIAAFIVAGMAALIVMMWRDLKSAVKDNKSENKSEFDKLWAAIRAIEARCLSHRIKGDE